MAILSNARYDQILGSLGELARWWWWTDFLSKGNVSTYRTPVYIREKLNTTLLRTDGVDNGTLVLQTALGSFRDSLSVMATNIIQEVASQMNWPTSMAGDYLKEAMVKDGKTIRQSTPRIAPNDLTGGQVKPKTGNVGDAKLVYTFNGDESALPMGMRFICTSTGVLGSESFDVYGKDDTRLGTLNSTNLLSSAGDFESLSLWTIESGTASLSNTDPFYGGYCLSAKSCVLSTQVNLRPKVCYAVGVWFKGAITAGSVDIWVEDALGSESSPFLRITSTCGSWTCFFAVGESRTNTPSTTTLKIKFNGLSDNVYIDQLQLVEMDTYNGVRWALIRGKTMSGVGDEFGYGQSEVPGVKIEYDGGDEKTTEASGCTQSLLIFSGNVSAQFPQGSYIWHSVDQTPHRIANTQVVGGNTQVTVVPDAMTVWNGLTVRSHKMGMIQRFLTSVLGLQLPSSSTPTHEDVVW